MSCIIRWEAGGWWWVRGWTEWGGRARHGGEAACKAACCFAARLGTRPARLSISLCARTSPPPPLTPQLNHFNLFGSGYLGDCERLLGRLAKRVK
jgi:hypothetical protein